MKDQQISKFQDASKLRRASKTESASKCASEPPHVEASTAGHPFLGTAALLLGAAIACLAFIDDQTGLPFPMPRSWYVNRPIWYFVALASFAAGYFLLRSRSRFSDSWRATRRGLRFHRVVLYTREGCHLCDHAKDILLKYSRYLPEIQEVDIDSDPQLVEQFATCIPVIEIDDRVLFRGGVNEVLLRRLIEGTQPRAI
jgi:glutaredoxin